jgi:hypothetical protein
MRAVDTNLLVRLITRDDPEQVEAAEGFVQKGAWISHCAAEGASPSSGDVAARANAPQLSQPLPCTNVTSGAPRTPALCIACFRPADEAKARSASSEAACR